MLNPVDESKEKLEPIKIRITPDDLSRSSSPNVGKLPMSVRQQLALINQMEQPSPGGSTDSERPSTPSRKRISRIHKKSDRGETRLHVLSRKPGATGQCLELIQQGAEVNCADYAGWTPLHEACSHRAFETAKLLIEHGADVNKAAEAAGETPLHDAVANNDIRIVWLLLRHNADRTLRTKDGRLPIDSAADSEIVTLLMSTSQPEECPRSRSISRQPSPVQELVREEHQILHPPIEEQMTIETLLPAPALTVSIGSPLNTDQVPASVDTSEEPSMIREAPTPSTLLPQDTTSILAVAPPLQNTVENDLEMSEQSSVSSSRAVTPTKIESSSHSASPEHPRDESVSRDTAAYDFVEEDDRTREEKIESLKKKSSRGRGRGGRSASGTSTPVTSAKKSARGGRGGRRGGRVAGRIAELTSETADLSMTEDPYAFRDTPDSEEGPNDEREMSVGPSSKKSRFDADETQSYYEPDDDEESTRVAKKVPILRISFAGQNKHLSEEDEPVSTYGKGKNHGARGKAGKRGADGDEQRITRSKVRQTGRGLDDGEGFSGKKKRHRMAPEPIVEETLDEYPPMRIVERQVTPNPETLTEGQKILYMPPYKGTFALKKKIEQRWVEDCKKDEENGKNADGQFKNLFLCSDLRPLTIDRIYRDTREIKYPNLPNELVSDGLTFDVFNAQDEKRRQLEQKMKLAKTRLQLTYEQEYIRMERRKNGTAPQMSAVRVFRETEILNPLILDATVQPAPQINREAFDSKVTKGVRKLFREHKMDSDVLYSMQREEWRVLFRRRSYSEDVMDRFLNELVPRVHVEELHLQFS